MKMLSVFTGWQGCS